ncbi:Thiamine import ATP-binding protein ThiQ [Streptococcus intermedius]|uniref:ATP-binding cassette domain-containing protein n=1 Tax=Streptococcus intermedius TaxID=1338 RepID=UPI000F68DD54|nr:ABC transporter ATP-binding protein [Streptococcus intermedius]RSJ20505.1 Thiamine import ATP-binding protein ThiQ [Streptococcus intermedius]
MQIYLKPLSWYFFFNLVFGGISNVCTALLPYFTQELVRGHYQIALYGYCLAVLCYLGCNYIQMRLDWKQIILFSTHLKNDWFHSLLELRHHDFKQKTVAEYISYQSNDLDSLEKDYLPPLMSFIKQILRILIYTVVISRTINPLVAFILLVSTVISIQIPKIVGKLTAQRRQVYLEKQGDYYRTLEDLLKGHHLVNQITLSGFQDQQRNALNTLQDKYLGYGLTKIMGILLTGLSFEFISIVLFAYLAYSLATQQLGIPEVVASFGYITAFSEPIQEILYDLQMLESVKPVVQSFQAIVSRPSAVQAPQMSFETLMLNHIIKRLGESSLTIPHVEIRKGGKIALIGENGSGKSSLLNILNGTDRDFQGEILLDHLPVHQLWGKFGMILQQEHTFISSYENNVTIFKTFEANFRDGKFEKIPPQSLSGGQQQHMYLNREKNRHSPLIIMDEPFSALDASQFKKELDKVLSLSSAVVLTLHHQEDVLSRFDQVWEIKDGELVVVKRVLKHD